MEKRAQTGRGAEAERDAWGPVKIDRVRVKKSAEIVADQVRNAIVRGELKPGETLPTEASLIERFEVSRPTIREAIRILESENLLRVSRGARGGAKIQSPNTDLVARTIGLTLQTRGASLADVYQARMLIEPPAARLAAELRPAEAAAALRAHVAHERLLLDDNAQLSAAIVSFHRLLVEQSGNMTLTLIADALDAISQKHLALIHRSRRADDPSLRRKRVMQGFKSNERLAAFIEAGNGDDAELHWKRHMAKVADFWLNGVENSGLDILD